MPVSERVYAQALERGRLGFQVPSFSSRWPESPLILQSDFVGIPLPRMGTLGWETPVWGFMFLHVSSGRPPQFQMYVCPTAEAMVFPLHRNTCRKKLAVLGSFF